MMTGRRIFPVVIVWLAGVLGAALTAGADPVSLGGEFIVDDISAANQLAPRVASSAIGAFVAVWQSPDGGDTIGIFARRYDSGGLPLGKFGVNTTLAGNQVLPSIAMNRAGQFVVAWQGPDAGGTGIYLRCFEANAVPASGEIAVNTSSGGTQETPAVAFGENGSILVVWRSAATGQDGSSGGIYGRMFTFPGTPVSAEFRINTTVAGDQADPAVAATAYPETAYFVTWEGPDANFTGIFLQRVAGAGVLVGPEIVVNTDASRIDENPAIAASSLNDFSREALDPSELPSEANRVVVVWQSQPAELSAIHKIWYRRFELDGTPTTGAIQIDDDPDAPEQIDPDVSIGDSAPLGFIPFIATWTELPDDGLTAGDLAIVGADRPRSADYFLSESLANPEFAVSLSALPAGFSSVAVEPDGDFVVVWQADFGDADVSDFGILGHRFARSEGPLFADGFESKDTSAWSLTVP